MNAAPAKFPNPFVLGTYSNKRAPAHAGDPYALQEIEMKALSYKIRTTEPDWHEQRHDPDVKAEWKKDALEKSKRKSEREQRCSAHQPMTAGMIDYAFDELEDFARFDVAVGGKWWQACFDAIYESDRVVPDDLRTSLLGQVLQVENANRLRSAASRSQVNAIVDPSWYPLMYGRTLVRAGDSDAARDPPTATTARVAEKPSRPENTQEYKYTSKKYQWLPADFEIDSKGQVKILSYINDLDPSDHVALYSSIASVFAELVPLLDQTLSDLLQAAPPIIPAACVSYWYEDDYEPRYSRHDYLGMDKHMRRHAREMAYLERLEHRRFVLPSPSSFEPSSTEKIQARLDNPCFTLKGRTVQVVVKFINYKLTPDQPTYDGDEWRVVGLRNECVVATALYCYDEENVTESSLAFRSTFDESDLPHPRSEEHEYALASIFGIEEASTTVQLLNSVPTAQGRCLTFPNVYQHRTGRFSLRDKTKTGHRKLMAFFLIDPTQRITSTTDVAPQQREWIERTLLGSKRTIDSLSYLGSIFHKLPIELWTRIVDLTEGLMKPREAKSHRNKMEAERSTMLNAYSRKVFVRPLA
ncbi:BZ3500_MvSof-1268-A1-R1_Chr11-1g03197 [Microbotryum saponariae]|uniref:BZ3500_MvSof-1268-A1-R1_Chr11-1g03197 protein n=1 Tax=Microbotryum saponariae TaxID=289078 RepID=A0A2X0LCT2_9BASI|nr:BZ3501_MvSof-1269-A2-R1_Chr11g02772 [Microbotryum saponariae]SDA03757.1 BZ3500_MvSof-1268-A1-R1_Chr11-1g03197 [Microbotryum saponariae]